MVSLDGYFEGADHDISWHNADNTEFNEFAIRQLDEVDTLLFGRRTYDGMAEYWPSEAAASGDPGVAGRMNGLRKIVFTNNEVTNEWQNVEISHDVVQRIVQLKEVPGKDVAVLGSSNLCVTLLRENLLDEVRLMVNPTVLGQGTPLFEGIKHPYEFMLTDTTTFASGNVLLTYKTN